MKKGLGSFLIKTPLSPVRNRVLSNLTLFIFHKHTPNSTPEARLLTEQ